MGNAKSGETDNDKALAVVMCEFISIIRPRVFTLENVWGYRNSESWRMIYRSLRLNGYFIKYDNVNFANLGVPQTRKRMIVRAVLDENLSNIIFTHEENPTPMFGLLPWVGWYKSVSDLINEFDSCEFAPWQINRMPDIHHSFLAEGRSAGGRQLQIRRVENPSMTITASTGGNVYRIFLLDEDSKMTCRTGDQPAMTILTNSSNRHRAFVRGSVLRLNVRALARLQSFPDSYVFTGGKGLSCKIIGNALPVAGMSEIFKQLVHHVYGKVNDEN